jgi:hypothetical protein
MSDRHEKGTQQPPFGLTQPILSGVIAMCLGIASTTAPDGFKTPLFALSMIVAVFAGWLLLRSQWPWFDKFHLRFKSAIVGVFVVLSALSVIASIVVEISSEGSDPIKFDSADYQLRTEHAVTSSNLFIVSNRLNAARNDLRETTQKLKDSTLELQMLSNKLGTFFAKRLSLSPEACARIRDKFSALSKSGRKINFTIKYMAETTGTLEFSEALEEIVTATGHTWEEPSISPDPNRQPLEFGIQSTNDVEIMALVSQLTSEVGRENPKCWHGYFPSNVVVMAFGKRKE